MSNSQNIEIPDGEILFRYCSPNVFPKGQVGVPISIFMDRELSCDWQKKRPNPKTSYHINEGKSRLISIKICDEIRNPKNPKRKGENVPDWKQEIISDPILEKDEHGHPPNEAHSLIKGLKKAPICDAIASNSRWEDVDKSTDLIDIGLPIK